MYPFYFYCLLSEGEPSANNMDIKKAQAPSHILTQACDSP